MKIRVIKAANNDCWYSDMVGEVFNVFFNKNSPTAFFGFGLFFYSGDFEVVDNKDIPGNLPSYNIGLA